MALQTYTELKAAAASYSKRSSLTDIADRITLAEQRIAYGSGDENDQYFTDPVRVPAMESSNTISILSGATSAVLPTGFLEFRGPPYISGAPTQTLAYAAPSVVRRNGDTSSSTKPTEYSIIGNTIIVAPATDAAYSIEADYYRLVALSDGVLTNDLIASYPAIYLYATLLEVAIFLKNDNDSRKYFDLFKASVHGANRQAKLARTSGGPLVIKSDGWTP